MEHCEHELSPEELTSALSISMASFARDAERACGVSPDGFRVRVLDELPAEDGYQLNIAISRADGQGGELRLFIELGAGQTLDSLPALEESLAAALNAACGVGILV